MSTSFRALRVEEIAGEYIRSIKVMDRESLPPGEVTIRVRYSSLNYKDALSASGNPGVTRKYPHTPGIDGAGEIITSASNDFSPGDEVIVTGYDLGMNTCGGLGQIIRVPASWVLPLPAGLTLAESMIYGTAGLTAALSVHALQKDVKPQDGPILVTGASGGVGSMAVALLAKLGYSVTAVTGKPETRDFLKELGAESFLTRQEASEGSQKPLLSARWAGVVDTVGGEILSAAIKASDMNATITCCGNVASPDLDMNVFPFILRGVRLSGIDSQHCPPELRQKVWNRLGNQWKLNHLEKMTTEISLIEVNSYIDKMLSGHSKGRILVNLD